jgi:HAD superfamily hydrolase (TIGR01450 family)
VTEDGATRGGTAHRRTTLPRFAGYAFDLDGTVYLGDDLLPGAAATIAALRAGGARIAFVTNKPLDTGAHYAAKLTALGIPAEPEDIVTAVDSTIDHLRATHPAARVMAIAEDVVVARLAEEGFEVTQSPERTEVVLVSFDRAFEYAKLHAAYRAVRFNGATIVATNPDPYCPTPDGGLPDCAAMLAALEACTGARAEAVCGKPSRQMAEAVLARLGVEAAAAAVVGDRLMTDVAMGQTLGAAGILVLTGATSAQDVADAPIAPDFVLGGIAELVADAGTSAPDPRTSR